MARFSRLEVLRTLLDTGLVPVFYHGDADVAIDVARASRRGGARILEFTHRGDMAHRVFEDLIQRCAAEVPDLVLGVGSVREPHTAALYLAAGANFVVSPLVDEGLARLCNGRKVALIPGCGTTTEVARAEELGCEICKVFPGDCVGGPNFVKAVRGPSPWSSLMPTGGVQVTAESIGAWVDAGAVAVGVGSALIGEDVVRRGDYETIERETARALELIREARAKAGGRS